jgi:hypothetical protein
VVAATANVSWDVGTGVFARSTCSACEFTPRGRFTLYLRASLLPLTECPILLKLPAAGDFPEGGFGVLPGGVFITL